MTIRDIYKTFYSHTEEYTSTFSSIEPISEHRASLNKFTAIEIIPSIFFSDHSGLKLEINNSRKMGKFRNMQKINYLSNNHWVKGEIQGEFK